MDETAAPVASGKGTNVDGETRRQILNAARELFLDRGYKGVSMRDIAEVVHVSQAALYYHFPKGKEEVLFAMMEDMLSHWNTQLQQIMEQGTSLRARLEYLARGFLTLPFDRMMVLLRDIHTLLPESPERDALHHRLAVNQEYTDAFFQTAMDAGEIRADLPAAYLSQLFGGMLMGTVRYIALKTQPPLPDDVAASIVSALLDGIITPT
jgi:AcrR family transcriptional regulator